MRISLSKREAWASSYSEFHWIFQQLHRRTNLFTLLRLEQFDDSNCFTLDDRTFFACAATWAEESELIYWVCFSILNQRYKWQNIAPPTHRWRFPIESPLVLPGFDLNPWCECQRRSPRIQTRLASTGRLAYKWKCILVPARHCSVLHIERLL